MTYEALINFLKLMDLNLYEAKVYLALLSKGSLSPLEAYKVAAIPQPRIYDILRSLVNKGFAREDPEKNAYAPLVPIQVFQAKRLNAMNKLKRQKEALLKKIDQIEKEFSLLEEGNYWIEHLSKLSMSETVNRFGIKILKGNETISNTLIDLFSQSNSEILNVSKNPPLVLYPANPIFESAVKAVKRGVRYTRILSVDYILCEGLKYVEKDLQEGIRIFVLSEDQIACKFYIFDNSRVLIRAESIDPESIYLAMLINSPEIVQALRCYWESLKSKAIPIEEFIKKIKSFSPQNLSSLEWKIYETFLQEGRMNIQELLNKGKFENINDILNSLNSLIEKGIVKKLSLVGKYQLRVQKAILNSIYERSQR